MVYHDDDHIWLCTRCDSGCSQANHRVVKHTLLAPCAEPTKRGKQNLAKYRRGAVNILQRSKKREAEEGGSNEEVATVAEGQGDKQAK